MEGTSFEQDWAAVAATAPACDGSLHGGRPAPADLNGAAKGNLDAVAGFGANRHFLDDPTVEEIWLALAMPHVTAESGRLAIRSTR
jgi:hypothetical protein